MAVKKWKDIDIKTKIALCTAVAAFLFGWGMTIAAFVIGAGVISDSVLWVLGQSLVYAGSVFGIGIYVSGSVKGMKQEIKDFMKHPEDETEEED